MGAPAPYKWSADHVLRLRQLAASGTPAKRIADMLGRSVFAVSSKCRALGVKLTSTDRTPATTTLHRIRRNAAAALERPPSDPAQSAPRAMPRPAAPASGSQPIPFFSAGDGQCRFSIDLMAPPSADMPVCGAPTIAGLSWCPACATRVFNRPDYAIAKLRSLPR